MTGRAGGFAIALLAIAAYVPALGAGYVWDDDAHVTRNPALDDLRGLLRIWTDTAATPQYYPLTHTTFWIERRLWGLRAPGYHAVNVALHAAAALFLWRVLARLGLPGAWLAAAVFAAHPVHVESVAWVSERKNVLSGVFYFSSALAFLAWRDAGVGRRGARPARAALAGSLFACALLSKTVTATLPFGLAIALAWQRGGIRRGEAALLAVMAAGGAAAGSLTAVLETYQIGTTGEDFSLSPTERVLVAGRAVFFYLGKLVWPARLSFVYPRWAVDPASPADWAYPAAAAATTAALWALKGKFGTGPFAAWAYFTVTLGPALGFFDVYPMRYSFVADHFQYLASVGPIAAAAAAATRGAAAARQRLAGWPRLLAPGASALLLALLALLAAARCRAYRDEETLWRDTLARNPSAWMAHNNLGILLASTGRAAEAEAHFEAAIARRPAHASAYANLGYLLLTRGDAEGAARHLRRAVELDATNLAARLHLGDALARTGAEKEAVLHYRVALVLDPSNAALRYNLGTLLARAGRLEEGIEHLREAVRLKPDLPGARENLELALSLARSKNRAGR